MSVLTVSHLCKAYPAFSLNDISFTLEKGKITGFIGRNGAGKTTTLKAMLDFVHPDSGEITFFGKPFMENELEIKQRIGFVSGGVSFYPTKKLKTITAVTRAFYPMWDDGKYAEYLRLFQLDERKTPAQLSEGMKVKYALVLALSHHADLLILDEPTSGLDPVSRDELLDVFRILADRRVTILFSTHITSDLDKCADNIIYIKSGCILHESDLHSFVSTYRVVTLPQESSDPRLIGCKKARNGCLALIRAADTPDFPHAQETDLETIMIHMEREETL